MTTSAEKCCSVLKQIWNVSSNHSFLIAFGSHEKLWENHHQNTRWFTYGFHVHRRKSFCILEVRGLIKITQDLLKTKHTHTERVKSWEIMSLSQFKNLQPVHCLKPNMGAGLRTQNHVQPRGKPRNTFKLSKDDNGNVRSALTPRRYSVQCHIFRMLFL